MYKWNDEIDIDKAFKTQILDSIVCSQNTMSLHFSNDSSITIYSGFELTNSDGNKESSSFPIQKTGILSLIGEKVNMIEIIDQTELLFTFSDISKLLVLGSNFTYECYIVHFGGKEKII